MRKLVIAYAVVIGLLIVLSWYSELAALHETRELPTAPEWILYVVCLPASHALKSIYEWRPSLFVGRFSDVVALGACGVIQLGVLCLITTLLPKGSLVAKNPLKGGDR